MGLVGSREEERGGYFWVRVKVLERVGYLGLVLELVVLPPPTPPTTPTASNNVTHSLLTERYFLISSRSPKLFLISTALLCRSPVNCSNLTVLSLFSLVNSPMTLSIFSATEALTRSFSYNWCLKIYLKWVIYWWIRWRESSWAEMLVIFWSIKLVIYDWSVVN